MLYNGVSFLQILATSPTLNISCFVSPDLNFKREYEKTRTTEKCKHQKLISGAEDNKYDSKYE